MAQNQLDATLARPAGWDAFYSFAKVKQSAGGYSGVATAPKPPLSLSVAELVSCAHPISTKTRSRARDITACLTSALSYHLTHATTRAMKSSGFEAPESQQQGSKESNIGPYGFRTRVWDSCCGGGKHGYCERD